MSETNEQNLTTEELLSLKSNKLFGTHTEKWLPVLESEDYTPIHDSHMRNTLAMTLENLKNETPAKNLSQEQLFESLELNETNSMGSGAFKLFDKPLTDMNRRMPQQLIAFDVCGVQPINAPNGLIFYLKTRYGKAAPGVDPTTLPEAGFGEANSAWTGTGTQTGTSYWDGTGTFTTGTGMDVATGELDPWAQMSITIQSESVKAITRNIRSEYTMEAVQDLRRVHNLSIESELQRTLSAEMINGLNREVIRTIRIAAKVGAKDTAKAGIFDLDQDSDGRMFTEKVRGLMYQMEKESNGIWTDTGRGRASIAIVSLNTASALVTAGAMDVSAGVNRMTSGLIVDSTSTFVGTMNGGKLKVFVDPYATSDGALLGYKGTSPFDNGVVYCPYTMMEYIAPVINYDNLGQSAFGYKTRYAMSQSPFTAKGANNNIFYRKFGITGLSAAP